MSTLTLRETRIVETNLNGIYVTDGERLFFMTAEQDNMPINPREDFNNCTICYVRNRYLGSSKYDNDMDFADSDDLNDYLAGLKDRGTEFVSVPLYAYVHSGITISTGSFDDPWDSGCFGVAICTKEQVVEAFGNDTDWQQHAIENYGMRGAPGLRVLLDDAEAIEGEIQRLWCELSKVKETA